MQTISLQQEMRTWPYIKVTNMSGMDYWKAQSLFVWHLDKAGRLTPAVVRRLNELLGDEGCVLFGSVTGLKEVRERAVVIS